MAPIIRARSGPGCLGPFLTAYVKVHGRTAEARRRADQFLDPLRAHLRQAGLGQISEVFDGDAPHRPAAVSRRPGAWPKCCGRTSRMPRTAGQPSRWTILKSIKSRNVVTTRRRPTSVHQSFVLGAGARGVCHVAAKSAHLLLRRLDSAGPKPQPKQMMSKSTISVRASRLLESLSKQLRSTPTGGACGPWAP